MTNGQKIRRVLFSRWGILTVLATLGGLYVMSFFDLPTRQNTRDNPFLIVLLVSVFIVPDNPFLVGLGKV